MRKLLVVAVLAACGPPGRDAGDDTQPLPDAAEVDAPPAVDTSRVYAHSDATLYRLDNRTFAAMQIGSMTGLDADLLDLAIDKNDKIVGTTATNLWSINAQTGAATLIKALTGDARGLTSLSYIPDLANPANPDKLVSANGQGQVFEIDPTTGTANPIGIYGTVAGGKVIRSSGDLIGVYGFGIYATVDIEGETNDYLARIDPEDNYRATPLGIGTGYDKIFGLGYWGGKIYGFVDSGFDRDGNSLGGKIVEIDPNTGKGTELSAAPIRWFGAGVATDAPIL